MFIFPQDTRQESDECVDVYFDICSKYSVQVSELQSNVVFVNFFLVNNDKVMSESERREIDAFKYERDRTSLKGRGLKA